MATNKSQSVEIRLLGQKIVLKASETDPELVREVVDLVSVKIKDAERRGKAQAPHQVLLLALLDLGEEYLRAKQRTLDYKQQIQEKSDRLLGLVQTDAK